MPTLEILSGNLAGKTFSFTEEAKIGKDETCVIRLSDAGVSRLHAHITRGGDGPQIEDIGSSNGTYVNFKKRPLGEKTILKDKDILFFGRTVAKFWTDAPPEGGERINVQMLRDCVPINKLNFPGAPADLEDKLRAKVREQELVEVIRRLGLHTLDANALDALLSQAR